MKVSQVGTSRNFWKQLHFWLSGDTWHRTPVSPCGLCTNALCVTSNHMQKQCCVQISAPSYAYAAASWSSLQQAVAVWVHVVKYYPPPAWPLFEVQEQAGRWKCCVKHGFSSCVFNSIISSGLVVFGTDWCLNRLADLMSCLSNCVSLLKKVCFSGLHCFRRGF